MLALDEPEAWGGLVDLPATADRRAADRLPAVLGGTEDQVALRAAGAYGRRLRPASAPADPWRPHGTVLVVGDDDSAEHLSRRFAADGAEHVLRASTADLREVLDAAPGPITTVVQAAAGDDPVADAERLVALLAGQPLDAVVLMTSIAAVWGVRGQQQAAADGAGSTRWCTA
ncbi:hypothetical protein [Saccharopolyspora gregorii]|uniref:Uncharacterized protein n=1 Tax=Saccharopolyspora gregorii TaxID=33914 RepID=A0ABP6RJ54_9PSEU